MLNYLVRRMFQMGVVVFLSTLTIYMMLNLAPGGPLSGLSLLFPGVETIPPAQRARMEAYLGIDKPLALRYISWLIGDDWLGADWVYLGLTPYREAKIGQDGLPVFEVDEETGEMIPVYESFRFWTEPGIPFIEASYPIWVWGHEIEPGVIEAERIQLKPTPTSPALAGVLITGEVQEVNGPELILEELNGRSYRIVTRPKTEYIFRPGEVQPRPEDDRWVNVSSIFSAYGLLGKYAGFHGDSHGILRLDLGTSWNVSKGQPVNELIKSRLGNTITLMSLATLISFIIAIPIGIYSAVHQYSRMDYAMTTFAFFGSAMPVFWFGLMMILIFSLFFKQWGLPFMPSGGTHLVRAPQPGSMLALLGAEPNTLVDRLVHILMPATVLSLLYMAGWSRFMRTSMLEVLRMDYVRTARSKGLLEYLVVYKHAARNALIPLITIIVFQLPGIFGGAILTETIFSYPGMGRLYFDALSQSDWPIVMVILFISAVLVVIATLIRDVLYTFVDPRIKLA